MVEDDTDPPKRTPRRHRPATTAEFREQQLVALAYSTAEEQMRRGTASAAVITHFLKLGTNQTKLEEEKLRKTNLLLEAKTKAMESQQSAEELYKNAIDAMRQYRGYDGGDDEDL